MISDLFSQLLELEDVVVHPGADAQTVWRCEQEHRWFFPAAYRELLQLTNGIEAYAGHYRLFGLSSGEAIDAIAWNNEQCWKFAWGGRCAGFWCFAETAWGDQYAFRIESLRAGEDDEVFFLDSMSMTPEVVASSFCEFFEKEFLRSAKAPYDAMMTLARCRFGPIDRETHLVSMPSPLLGVAEDLRNVHRMNARAAMICNGDLAVQVDNGPPEGVIQSLCHFLDERQRQRIRVVWK